MITVSVLGLGHMGLPIACLLADVGHRFFGVDCDVTRLDNLRQGRFAIPEPGLNELFHRVFRKDCLSFSSVAVPANVYIIAVSTPLGTHQSSDLSYINVTPASLKPLVKKGNLVLVISTCPLGTTQHVAKVFDAQKQGIYVVCCPERAVPGAVLHEMVHSKRIVGGFDKASAEKAERFYATFTRGAVFQTDVMTVEVVSLA